MKVTYAEGVFEELVNLSAYLALDSEELAHRFLDACDTTFRFLAANPHSGAERQFTRHELSRVRMWRVRSFEKYLIFYVPTEDGVRILHVFHSARDYNRLFENE